jgi:hypothetical protein
VRRQHLNLQFAKDFVRMKHFKRQKSHYLILSFFFFSPLYDNCQRSLCGTLFLAGLLSCTTFIFLLEKKSFQGETYPAGTCSFVGGGGRPWCATAQVASDAAYSINAGGNWDYCNCGKFLKVLIFSK